jgi:large repetitive protein
MRGSVPRALGAFALASAILLLSFAAAQAQTATTTQLISGPNPSVAGQPVTFTATVVPATPGSQTPSFFDGGNPIGTAPLGPNSTIAVADLTIATLAVGSHTITTSYNGDSNFGGSNGGPLTQVVNKNGTNTLILSSLNPSTAGKSVTFNIVISPVTGTAAAVVPTGTVNVFDNGTLIGSPTLSSVGGNSSANVTTSALTTGSHTITMSYAGDANFNGNSNGSLTQQVNPPVAVNTSLTLSSSPTNSSSFGQSVTFTATINGGVWNDESRRDGDVLGRHHHDRFRPGRRQRPRPIHRDIDHFGAAGRQPHDYC